MTTNSVINYLEVLRSVHVKSSNVANTTSNLKTNYLKLKHVENLTWSLTYLEYVIVFFALQPSWFRDAIVGWLELTRFVILNCGSFELHNTTNI